MTRYRILTQWLRDGRDELEDTGVTIEAHSPDDALFRCQQQGHLSGHGFQWPRYQGAVAVELIERVTEARR